MTGNSDILMMLCAGVLCGIGAVLAYRSRWEQALPVYAALWLVKATAVGAWLSIGQMLFWGAAAAIAAAITLLLPEQVRNSRTGVPFIAIGALAGALVGAVGGTVAAIVVGAALGAVFGGVIASRTRSGAVLEFPTRRFFNYLLAKGLPMTVTMSMVGIIIAMFLRP